MEMPAAADKFASAIDCQALGDRLRAYRIGASLLAEDALIFGLRTNEGVDLAVWRARAPEAPWPHIEDTLATLAAGDLLIRDGDAVRLTDRGRLIADTIAVEVMAAFEPITETA